MAVSFEDAEYMRCIVRAEIRRGAATGEAERCIENYIRSNVTLSIRKHGDIDYVFSLCLQGRPFYSHMICFQETEVDF